MNARLLHIGVLDHDGKTHGVSLKPGVNVITGKSSTGKSALIEIFDYCFGSSEFTVPVGVITETSTIYFIALQVNSAFLVLARRPNDSKGFFREEADIKPVESINKFGPNYFEDQFFLPKDEFKAQLTAAFGVTVVDVDEDPDARSRRRHNSRAPAPSARSFSSYMLQHQNLVANKHAVFYRFDQLQKREQAIEHLKVFLGFADQEYFYKSQELMKKERELRQLALSLPKKADEVDRLVARIADLVDEYESATGRECPVSIEDLKSKPKSSLRLLHNKKLEVTETSNKHAIMREQAKDKLRQHTATLRSHQHKLEAISHSIKFAQQYSRDTENTATPDEIEIKVSSCPFCGSQHNSMEAEANRLVDAVNWLNNELSCSLQRIRGLEEDKRSTTEAIEEEKAQVHRYKGIIERIDRQTETISQARTQYELGVEVQLRLEQAIEQLVDLKATGTDDRIKNLKDEIERERRYLAENYNMEQKLQEAEKRIGELLFEIGKRFEFESTYTPIRLHFDLGTFDLWHETEKKEKVYLRSMGSGANWLGCHLVLFLALHRYFCERADKCTIPPIMFFDQPSQVYFPSVIDSGAEFLPDELAKNDATRRPDRQVDEDVRAVTNVYDQFVTYCREVEAETGIMPQIIVTDHADHLVLKEENGKFENLVRKRWRTTGTGFIDRVVL